MPLALSAVVDDPLRASAQRGQAEFVRARGWVGGAGGVSHGYSWRAVFGNTKPSTPNRALVLPPRDCGHVHLLAPNEHDGSLAIPIPITVSVSCILLWTRTRTAG